MLYALLSLLSFEMQSVNFGLCELILPLECFNLLHFAHLSLLHQLPFSFFLIRCLINQHHLLLSFLLLLSDLQIDGVPLALNDVLTAWEPPLEHLVMPLLHLNFLLHSDRLCLQDLLPLPLWLLLDLAPLLIWELAEMLICDLLLPSYCRME